MSAGQPELSDGTQALRALLVRFLLEASPDDPRFAQLIAAMEQVVSVAREGLDQGWRQDLASMKADLGKVRQAVADTSTLSLPRIEGLLAQSDSQLAALLKSSEERSQAQLAKLGALVTQLAERVQKLEAQIQKLSTGRP
jgi:hypothetical protein